MRILFLSHYFPPEVNAPASRVFENCREWARRGHEVHVVTGFPSHPTGRLYPGHARAWYRTEELEGIRVHRVWTYLAANRGLVRRTLNYATFVPAAVWRSLRLGRFDVVLGTSPHFFNALAAWLAASLRATPWVFELRDLWPESIVAVGALRPSWPVRVLDRLARHLYRRADAVVCVTRSFVEHLTHRGVEAAKLAYVPNGVFPDAWRVDEERSSWRREAGIEPRAVVASYVGTVGLAHGLETLLDAADRLRAHQPEIRFVVAGEGADRQRLVAESRRRGIDNMVFTGQLPRSEVPRLLSGTDICLILLRDHPVFRTVLPSKMFEALAAARPIVLAVAGEARRVLEESGGGIPVPPQDPAALSEAVSRLARDPALRLRMGASGSAYVRRHFDRRQWALAYLAVLERCAGSASPGRA